MNKRFKIGIFDDEEKFLSSIRSLKEQKLSIHDVFTPYPVHEVFHLLKRKSRLPTAAYFFGLAGIIATLAFLYYTSVLDWPIVYGGKPFNSFPSFIVVTIVITIFTVTIASLALFSARSKLFPGRDNTIFDPRATDDKFIIVVESDGVELSASDTAGDIMKQLGAVEVMEKEFGNVNE
ncbi:MAG: DUF3341 domain-containing protein [Bacteroidales bacterium]|nr:DUF3341 domain-containing protein [Bacteroidales bacterium]